MGESLVLDALFCHMNFRYLYFGSGLPVKNPVGPGGRPVKKRGQRVQKKRRKILKDESDSEEEWQPWMEENKHKPKRNQGMQSIRSVWSQL